MTYIEELGEKDIVEEIEGVEEFEDLKDAILALDADDKRELDELHKELMHRKLHSERIENELKKRVSLFLLDLVEKTPETFDNIRRSSYIISGFNEYEFGDSLDAVTDMSKELEESFGVVDGSIFEMWGRMREILEEY